MGSSRRSSMAVVLLLSVAAFLLLQGYVVCSQAQTCSSVDLKALEGIASGLKSGKAPLGWVFSAPSISSSSSSSSPSSPSSPPSSGTSCCQWVGITCDSYSTSSSPSSSNSTRRVVELNLSSMGLEGSISPSLPDLDQLTVLDLSNNSLGGAVPPGLFHLPHLRILNLSFNRFSSAIPVDSYLPSIRYFNVSFNNFNGNPPVLVGSRNLTEFDASRNDFNGSINAGICSESPRIKILNLSCNKLTGEFPMGFGNCSSLQKLGLESNSISGSLPDDLFKLSLLRELYLEDNLIGGTLSRIIGNLSELVQLDLSSNYFSGKLPDSFGNLRKLQSFAASSNRFVGSLPSSMSNLYAIQVINLRNNSLSGEIILSFSKMVNLSSLDLGSNQFSGKIPADLTSCFELKTVNLARNMFQGEIPEGFKNLGKMSFLSLSNNSLSNISSALGILQNCPNLTTLVLTMNFHGDLMPSDGIQGFQNLELLVIANCDLLGKVPPWLPHCTQLQLLDLSWNQLTGNIPSWFGDFNYLFYLDLSNNTLDGEIPMSLTNMTSLVYSSTSNPGSSSTDFPFFSKRNNRTRGLQYNQLSSFPPSLILSSNKLVGLIWPEFERLKRLHVLDLSNNNLSGTIPSELSGMTSLEILDLSHNDLTGSIPSSLSKLTFLSKFNVAYNDLVGPIPNGAQFSTFPNASFYGNPHLCREHSSSSCNETTKASPPSDAKEQNSQSVVIGMTLGIGCGTVLIVVIVYLVVSRKQSRRVEDTEKELVDSNDFFESSGSRLVLLFQHKDNKEITIEDILKSTNNFDQANIIGCGGFGLVYKATLPDGRKVAVKRLSGDYGQMEREFQAEVETLSSARHENLVLLQGYCRVGNDRLLIYTYMENGSLDYWLHEKLDGGSTLNWSTRLRIAQGAAKGLAHLHESCEPHILHRDIKSSNILLNEKFEAHLADFGLARLIRPYDTHVTTDLVGTLGYIPPEYGQSSVATFKGDVYSFGVVLLELLTGRRPMDMCKAREHRDLISWVLQMKKEKREDEVLDPFIYDKQHDNQLLQMLDIACLCLNECPKLRPMIQQIVSWLDEIGVKEEVSK